MDKISIVSSQVPLSSWFNEISYTGNVWWISPGFVRFTLVRSDYCSPFDSWYNFHITSHSSWLLLNSLSWALHLCRLARLISFPNHVLRYSCMTEERKKFNWEKILWCHLFHTVVNISVVKPSSGHWKYVDYEQNCGLDKRKYLGTCWWLCWQE